MSGTLQLIMAGELCPYAIGAVLEDGAEEVGTYFSPFLRVITSPAFFGAMRTRQAWRAPSRLTHKAPPACRGAQVAPLLLSFIGLFSSPYFSALQHDEVCALVLCVSTPHVCVHA
jgi:hypothetical protein